MWVGQPPLEPGSGKGAQTEVEGHATSVGCKAEGTEKQDKETRHTQTQKLGVGGHRPEFRGCRGAGVKGGSCSFCETPAVTLVFAPRQWTRVSVLAVAHVFSLYHLSRVNTTCQGFIVFCFVCNRMNFGTLSAVTFPNILGEQSYENTTYQ